MINFKHVLFKRSREQIIPYKVYNDFKNNLNKIKRSVKSQYYKNKFSQIHNDTKENWKMINEIMGRKKKQKSPDIVTDTLGNDITDPMEISNQFCNYFSTIASKLDNVIPTSNVDPMHYMPEPVRNSFYAAPTSEDEVTKVIMELPNKGKSFFCVPVFVYKRAVGVLSPMIADIFNSSIMEGVFPDKLKQARTIPIYKSKNRKLLNNFRPISILNTLSKILEKLMKGRVMSFLNSNRIISNKQYGFRAGYGTSDCVQRVVDECADNLDKKLHTIAVYLDFSKAFDTVQKHILIKKMERLGFRGIASD